MGFITQFSNKSFNGQGRESNLWREVFGATNKEEGMNRPPGPAPSRGDGYGRSIVGESSSFKRLLQAFRSMAPGGWSDDRWEQTKHYVGICWTSIHRTNEQLTQAEVKVYQKDDTHPNGKREITKRTDPQAYKLVELLECPNRDDDFGELMACFPSGTRIRLADGTLKSIEDVEKGNRVLTAEGNIGEVKQLHVRKFEGELVHLHVWGNNILQLTPDHPVLTKEGYKKAKDLTNNDWVAIPRYKPSETKVLVTTKHLVGETVQTKSFFPDKDYGRESKVLPSTRGQCWANFNKVPEKINLTYRVGRLLGLWLAEGSSNKNSLYWTFHKKEVPTLASEVSDVLLKEFNLKSTIRVYGNSSVVTCNGKMWIRFFKSLCGFKAGSKRIHSDLLKGPDDFLEGLFSGWWDGDGGSSVSHDLALQMFNIANYLGKRPGINIQPPQKICGRINGNEIKSRQSMYSVYLRSTCNNSRNIMEEKNLWRRVRNLKRKPFVGLVYNIGVEGDNSYTAESIGVHNCWNMQMDLTGSALTWMVPNALGIPYELYSIPTAIAIPQPAVNPDYPDGYYRIQPVYPYGPFSSFPTPTSAVGAAIPAQWILKFKYPHPFLRYDGYSPSTALRLHIDEVESIDRSRWYAMKRGIEPSAVVNFDELGPTDQIPEGEIQRIQEEFASFFQGPENVGRLLVSAPGSRIEPWGLAAKDMDYQSGWEQLVSFVMAGYGITKPAAGMIDDASYATLFATLKQFHLLTLQPKCARIARKLTRHLAPFFGEGLIVDIQCQRIDDHDVRNAKIGLAMQAMCITKNEVRKELDMPVTQEMWGNDIAGFPPQMMPLVPPGEDPQLAMLQQQQMMQQLGMAPPMPGMMSGNNNGGGGGDDKLMQILQSQGARGLANLLAQDQHPDETNVRQGQPGPGNLGRGALGPRKALIQKNLAKSRKNKVYLNGNGFDSNGHWRKK